MIMALTDRAVESPPAAVPAAHKKSASAHRPALQAIQGGMRDDLLTPRQGLQWRTMLTSGWMHYLLGAVSIGSVLLLWYLATKYRWDFYVRFGNIPTPGDVWRAMLEVNQSTKFLTSVWMSLRRILQGFFVAAVVGVALGILIGR